MVTIQLLTVTITEPDAPELGEILSQDLGPGVVVDPPPRWPTLAAEFPDFLERDLPPIPEGFSDSSWHNDACPSFTSEALGVRLWVDYADRTLSEHAEGQRFGAQLLVGAERDQCDDGPEMGSDHWPEVLAWVEGAEEHRRRYVAAKGAKAFRALQDAIKALENAYDEHGLNDYQPPHVSGVIPMSVDEWWFEASAATDAWEAIAKGEEPEPDHGGGCFYMPEPDGRGRHRGAVEKIRAIICRSQPAETMLCEIAAVVQGAL